MKRCRALWNLCTFVCHELGDHVLLGLLLRFFMFNTHYFRGTADSSELQV